MKSHEIEEILERTERNRKEIPETVLQALECHNITLQNILCMNRREFDNLLDMLYLNDNIANNDRRYLVNFKHESMTKEEHFAYFDETEEDYKEIEEYDDIWY